LVILLYQRNLCNLWSNLLSLHFNFRARVESRA
jgi:hypothetical protein